MSILRVPPSKKAIAAIKSQTAKAPAAPKTPAVKPAATEFVPPKPRAKTALDAPAGLPPAAGPTLRLGPGGRLTELPRTDVPHVPNGVVPQGKLDASKAFKAPLPGVSFERNNLTANVTAADVSLATAAVHGAQEAARKAQEDLAKYEQELAATLASAGPGLTESQRQMVTEQFWLEPTHARAREEVNRTQDELSARLEEYGPILEEAAASPQWHGDSPATLLQQSYEVLAKSPEHADEAIEFAGRVHDDGALHAGLVQILGEGFDQQLVDTIAAPAMAAAQEHVLAEYPATPEGVAAAMERLQAIVEPLKSVKGIADQVRTVLSSIQSVREGNWIAAAEGFGKFDSASPFGKACRAFTLAAGIYAGLQGGDQTAQQEFANFMKVGRGGLEVTASVLKALGESSAAKTVAGFATKLGGYLDLFVDAEALAADLKKIANGDANAGTWVKALGDTVAVIGDLLPPGLGTAVSAVGDLVAMIGATLESWIQGGEDAQAIIQRRHDLLRRCYIDEDTATLLANAGAMGAQLGTFGLTPEQYVEALKTNNSFADDELARAAWYYGLETAAIYGLRGEDAIHLATKFVDKAREVGEPFLADLGGTYLPDLSRSGANHEGYIQGSYNNASLLETLEEIFGRQFVLDHGLLGGNPDKANTDFFEIPRVFEGLPGAEG